MDNISSIHWLLTIEFHESTKISYGATAENTKIRPSKCRKSPFIDGKNQTISRGCKPQRPLAWHHYVTYRYYAAQKLCFPACINWTVTNWKYLIFKDHLDYLNVGKFRFFLHLYCNKYHKEQWTKIIDITTTRKITVITSLNFIRSVKYILIIKCLFIY